MKHSTLIDYESYARVHLLPAFGRLPLDAITVELIEDFIIDKRAEGKATKSILNWLGLLHAILAYAVKRGWCQRNPAALVDKPRGARERDIRFLDARELEALLEATPADSRGTTERVLYLTAAMTGLRRGELLALRWQDVDWPARLLRVRRNYSRGQFGSPKTRRSSRAVPLAERVTTELRSHFEHSRFQEPTDLVFCHPELGTVLDPSKLRRASRPPHAAPDCARSASTTSATHSEPGWPRSAHPCARSRNGSATATTAPPASTPTTRPTFPRPRTGRPARSRLTTSPTRPASTNPSRNRMTQAA